MPIFDPESWKRLLYADEDTWIDFTGTHALQHRQFDIAIREAGGVPYPVLPIGDTARTTYLGEPTGGPLAYYPDESWHAAHQVMHDGMAVSLFLAASPDFQSYDLTDAEQFATWTYLHSAEHIRIRESLGI